jgi:methionine-rich copper-binding protein CopC
MNRFESYSKRLKWFSAALLLPVFMAGCGGAPDNGSGLTGAKVSQLLLLNGGKGPAPVSLGTADNFVILAKTGITTTGATSVVGNIGVSPIASTAMTGFGLIADATNVFSTSSLVTGKIYAADYATPTPANLTTAVSDMEAAYTDAAGRTAPDFTELGTGNISGLTLVPGLYKWSTGVSVNNDVTLDGGPNDVWIFQIAGDLSVASAKSVILTGGALPKNIFWQVAGKTTLGTTSSFKGIILSKTQVVMQTGAAMNGKTLAQTQVTLDANAVTSAAASDAAAPTVSSTLPANAATGVAIGKAISTVFSEAMDPATINSTTFTLKHGTTSVAGFVTYAGSTATFTPAAPLAADTLYSATISTGAKDLAGNALANNVVWSFTTGEAPDTKAPTVTSTTPADGATGVAINKTVSAAFSEAMDPSRITTATFTLKRGTTSVSGTVTYAGTTATFTPAVNLSAGALYTATISTGVRDLAGNALATNHVWRFTTGYAATKGLAPVSLGMAGNYVILTKSGISTVPTSAITGNMGVSPAAATYITGFALSADPSNVFSTATQVTGKVYAANYAVPTPSNLTTAVSNMEAAYTDAAGRAIPDFTELGAGEIGGLTLVPGLYKWGTGVLITTDVTLNGGPNDVWIFQIAGGLTQANGKRVILTGGALPKNIFWQVAGGNGVALGTTSHFEGVILAQTAITLNTGASINGRLLAQTAVTLKSSTVTQPAP